MDINQKITRRGYLWHIFPKGQNRKTLFQFSLMRFPFHLKLKKIGRGNKVRKRMYNDSFDSNGNFKSKCHELRLDSIYQYLDLNGYMRFS